MIFSLALKLIYFNVDILIFSINSLHADYILFLVFFSVF